MSQKVFRYVCALQSVLFFSLAFLGCRPPPSEACQGARVSWPFLEFTEGDDESDEPGVQISLELRTSLSEGTTTTLRVAPMGGDGGADGAGDESGGASLVGIVDEEGTVFFESVTILDGEFFLSLDAEVDCGSIRSERTAFLRTSQNDLRCSFGINGENQIVGELTRVLDDDADTSLTEAGVQALLEVETGLPNTAVEVFIVNETTDEELTLDANTAAATGASFNATFENGFYNIRSVCENNDATVASPTLRYRVEL